MAFIDALERLHHAPKKKRMIVLIVIVSLCMIGIIGIWVLQLQNTFSGKSISTDSVKRPFDVIWSAVKEKFKSDPTTLYENR